MLRKTAIIAVLLAAPLGLAHADPDAGCGAGTKIWKGEKGTAPKVFAATTNASFGNQTFGISSGTLGCSQNGVVTGSARLQMFAGANFDQLQADIAAGRGEALTALAGLYGIADADRAAFHTLLKANYSRIFTDPSTTSDRMLASVESVMKADGRFARYVA